jgi:hypothetical protein
MTAMDATADDDQLRSRAIGRLRKQRDFRMHLTTYLLVNGLLIATWILVGVFVGAWFPWPIFPLIGWGIGLMFHWRAVYRPDISEVDIAREIDRLRGQQ